MSTENVRDSIKDKKQDADELIREVVQNVPESRKKELLGIVKGFALGAGVEGKVS